uniref:Interleukin 12A n=1 Tax=Myripristis murdjan TaxID=586833 RepID=A0A667YE77_9TELE
MANFYLFLTCALMLAVCWRTSTGSPVPTATSLSADKCGECSELSKALLRKITELLNNDLFTGVRRNAHPVVDRKGETALVCAPSLAQVSNMIYSRNTCLENIMKDLTHYAAVLKSYKQISPKTEAALLDPTLKIIQSLLEVCLCENIAQMWEGNRFDQRWKMYRVMKGFHIRTITINRAMGYISSGDHRN